MTCGWQASRSWTCTLSPSPSCKGAAANRGDRATVRASPIGGECFGVGGECFGLWRVRPSHTVVNLHPSHTVAKPPLPHYDHDHHLGCACARVRLGYAHLQRCHVRYATRLCERTTKCRPMAAGERVEKAPTHACGIAPRPWRCRLTRRLLCAHRSTRLARQPGPRVCAPARQAPVNRQHGTDTSWHRHREVSLSGHRETSSHGMTTAHHLTQPLQIAGCEPSRMHFSPLDVHGSCSPFRRPCPMPGCPVCVVTHGGEAKVTDLDLPVLVHQDVG